MIKEATHHSKYSYTSQFKKKKTQNNIFKFNRNIVCKVPILCRTLTIQKAIEPNQIGYDQLNRKIEDKSKTKEKIEKLNKKNRALVLL